LLHINIGALDSHKLYYGKFICELAVRRLLNWIDERIGWNIERYWAPFFITNGLHDRCRCFTGDSWHFACFGECFCTL